MHLELDLNEHLRIVVEKDVEQEEVQKTNARKQTELLVQMIDRKALKATALAKKVLRWPIGQTLPHQLTYNAVEEHLLVIGPTSEAIVPLTKSKIDALTATAIAKAGTTSKAKTFSSFAVNPIETFDVRSVSKAVQNVIEKPDKEKRWKQLTEKLGECTKGEANGALSAVEQTQLVEAIQKYTDDPDSETDAVDAMLKAVAVARILTYRNEETFLRHCIAKEKKSVLEVVLNDASRVTSEFILAELLKLAAAKPEKERRKDVIQVIGRNFSKTPMIEATAEVLTAAESVEIMTALMEIYKDFKKQALWAKAVSLITILMDAHGSRIVYEDKLHQKFAVVSNFIIEMQSLVGTFARLESAIEETAENVSGNNVVIRIRAVVHPMTW